MKKTLFFLLGIALPLSVSCLLYLLYRPNNLKIFALIEQLGYYPFLQNIRANIQTNLLLPAWSFNSLPGSLWMFGMLNSLLLIWRFEISRKSVVWLTLPALFAVGLEFLQLLHITDGSFDGNDLLAYFFALILFVLYCLLFATKVSTSSINEIKKQNSQSLILSILLLGAVYGSDKITLKEVKKTTPYYTYMVAHHRLNNDSFFVNYPLAKNRQSLL